MTTKNRTRIQTLVLVNWKGFFYQPFEMDGGVTALEGENGAGKTTVMIAAFVALLPDQRLLQFRNVSEGGTIEGDRGIFGRLGSKGAAYAILELLTSKGGRILAGVMLRRKAPPSLDLTRFIIEGLARDVSLEEVLLIRDAETESVPELSDLRQIVGALGGSLKVCESVGEYTSRLFDLGVVPMRMEAYAERDRFNRMLQTSMYGGLSSSIQKGLRDYLLAEDPSLRNHVARMRENLDACRVTRQEIASADQKYKTIQGVFKSGYGLFEAAFHGTRLRVVGLRKNADAGKAEHNRCKSERSRAQRQKHDLERRHAEVNSELESRQWAYGEAEALWNKCRQAREIALEIERQVPMRMEAVEELERTERLLRSVEQRFRECEWKRDRLLAEKEQNAEGMADAQKAWEQVSRKVALYKQANEALHDARKTFPDLEVTDRSAENLLSECRDQWNRALDSKARIERELESLEIRILRYEQVLEALREASQKDCTAEGALETARELDFEFREMARRVEETRALPMRMEEARNLLARQQEVRRKVTLLEGRGETIECAADLRFLFESMQIEQDLLVEERGGLRERFAILAGERAQAEQQIERLQAEAAEWRESHQLVRKLEDGFGATIGDGPALENLKAQLEEDLTTSGHRLRRLEEERETARKRVVELEFGGGWLDESLVRLRDLVDGRLLAELYDEVSETDAATVEARLGPLHGALLVGDVPEAARTIAQEPEGPEEVWLMDSTALRDLPEGKSYPAAELVNMGVAWRLTRHPERPVVGRAAREREIDRLRGRDDPLLAEVETVRAEGVRFQEGVKTIAVLSRYYRFLGAVDPGESVNRLQNRLSEIQGEERRNLRRTEEIDLRLKHCREVLHELTQCLPDANLVDDTDWGERLEELQRQHREAGTLKDRMESLQPAMERVRAGWLDLEYPPPGPERVQARRQALERAEAVLNTWSKGRELLSMLVDRLPHLSYSDQEKLMTEQASALEALKQQMGIVDREFQAAKAEVESVGKDLEQAREGFHKSDASYKVLHIKVESLRQDQARIGEDGSRQSLDDAERSKAEVKKQLAAVQGAERKMYGDLIVAGKDVQIAESNTAAARERRRGDLEALWPHWRNWMSLKRRAVREGLADRLLDPRVAQSYDQKSPPRAFEESSGHQGELKRILLSVPQGEKLWQELERIGEAQNGETRRGSHTLDSWLMIRAFLEKSIPRDIAHADDPETALRQIEDHLKRLNGRLLDQEKQLRYQSDSIANSIRSRIRREERQIHRINRGLEAISFGTIASIRIRLERVEALQRLLDGLKVQKDLFGANVSLEEAMTELYRQVGGGQVRGDQLLDYREYVRMSVEVQRLASEKWTKATSSVLSTGESIGVGAAVLMVILDAWEHQAVLLRGKGEGGSLRFLFLDEAARLSPRSLDTLGELCERMDLQLLVAAPAADRARRGTAYRLVRRIGEDGGEEVVVRGRRFTGG
jgi:chromosome partition protein MukB